MENRIQHILSLETDGETLEYIIRQIGMEHQMLRQLIMTMPVEEIEDLLAERRELASRNASFEPDEVDLFEHPELLPQRLQIVLSKIDSDMTYAQCEALLHRVERMGYTFEYGLDAQPFNLRPLNDVA